MSGKPGMKGSNLGGRRVGAGRPFSRFIARKGDSYVMERETIGGVIRAPELWTVLSVSASEIEFQCGDDIIVISVPKS